MSKKVLSQMDVLSFMTISHRCFLGVVCALLDEPFFGFSDAGWFVLFIQAVVCQLTAWLSISYAQHMRTTRVSLSLLGQLF
jgi:hypothetical protein